MGKLWLFKLDIGKDVMQWASNLETLGKTIEALASDVDGPGQAILLEHAREFGQMICDYSRTINLSVFEAEEEQKKEASAEPRIQTEAHSDPKGSRNTHTVQEARLDCNGESGSQLN